MGATLDLLRVYITEASDWYSGALTLFFFVNGRNTEVFLPGSNHPSPLSPSVSVYGLARASERHVMSASSLRMNTFDTFISFLSFFLFCCSFFPSVPFRRVQSSLFFDYDENRNHLRTSNQIYLHISVDHLRDYGRSTLCKLYCSAFLGSIVGDSMPVRERGRRLD